jgi:hypothetical protein
VVSGPPIASAKRPTARVGASRERDVTLLDLLDRLLGGGVVVQGEIMLAAADIDLVHVGLNLVVASVDTLAGGGAD